jgi:polysaccharide pyruvyl transferase WcaK-like protein
MSNVLLVGAFGQGNPGDEALCAAFCQALEGADVTVASRTPGATTEAHGVRAIPASARFVAPAVARADLVVVGGGTVFKSLHRSTGRHANGLLRSTAALVQLARLRGTRVAMVGVGAGELAGSEAKRLARWLVRHTDLLVLRDEESAALLTGIGATAPFRIGADPAWSLLRTPSAMTTAPPVGQTVTVALSHLAEVSAARLAVALERLPEHHHVQLQPWQTGLNSDDARLAHELHRHLGERSSIIPPPLDLLEARSIFSHDRLVVALRFHAVVAAAAAGSRVVALAHEPKLAGLARRLEQAAVPASASTDVLARAIAGAVDRPPPAPTAVLSEMASAEEGFMLLKLLLGRGQDVDTALLDGLSLSNGAGTW